MSHRAAPARSLLLAGAVLLAALAGCSDGDGGDEPSDTTTTTTTSSPIDASETTEAGSGKPLNESDLVDSLIDPAEVAEGLEVSPAAGAGDLATDLCPDVTIEVSWLDQAAQGMVRRNLENGLLVVNQSVLAFADTAGAESFVADLVDAYLRCDPSIPTEEVAGVGDQALFLGAAAGGDGAASVVMVRAGVHVVRLDVNGSAADAAEIIDADLARALAALLPPP